MGAKKKQAMQAMQETGRWLRVGTLMLTALGPAIKLFTERLRAQKASTKGSRGKGAQNSHATALPFDAQEKLQSVGAALTDVFIQLREHPYSQDLLQRGGHLTDELQERWNAFLYDVVRRSEHSDLEARKNIYKHQKMQYGQKQHMWVFLGFGVGISVAIIATVLLLRSRQKQLDDVTSLQFSNGAVNHAGTEYKREDKRADKTDAVSKAKTSPQQGKQGTNTPGVALADTQPEERNAVVPTGAVLVGVVNTMRYYPVETPPGQLPRVHGQALDLIYFVSEAEAKAHGFTAAE